MNGDVAAARPKLPPAYRLIERDSVTSSNDEARALAEAGAEDGTLLWAREQTAGRGRQGRGWDSPRGNLYLSLVLRPDCAAAEAAQLGFVAALALGEAIGSVAPPLIEVKYKWPNDVLLNERKVAGILLESQTAPGGELDFMILGVGVNLASFPRDSRFPATSLHFEGTPTEVGEVELLDAFSRYLLSWINRWLDDGFAPVRHAWRNHAFRLGEEIEVRLPKETLTGTFKDLDESGALLLDLPGGELRRISAGDVHFGA
ncbi:MAG: biotin--[acetyl-CoA-carboxylase] ligase [Kiloniellales bacterium]|jgi:BirA family biotin operon repressor/biotin-[acetyl-CoA-carboxylase] ligase